MFLSNPAVTHDICYNDSIENKLSGLLKDEAAHIRQAAAVALAEIILFRKNTLTQMAKASGIFEEYKEEIERHYTGGIDMPELETVLTDGLKAFDNMVRLLAIACTGKLRLFSAKPILHDLLIGGGNSEEQRFSAIALSEIGDEESVSWLKKAAWSSKNDLGLEIEGLLHLSGKSGGGKRSSLPENTPYLEKIEKIGDFSAVNSGMPAHFMADLCTGKTYFFSPEMFPFHYDFAKQVLKLSVSPEVFYKIKPGQPDLCSVKGVLSQHGDLFTAYLLPEPGAAIEKDAIYLFLKNKISGELELVRGELDPVITRTDWRYILVNPGTATGRLRIVYDALRQAIGPEDVVVFASTPEYFPEAAAFLITEPLSPAVHSAILAHSQFIPSASVPKTGSMARYLDGLYVTVKMDYDGYWLRPAFPWERTSSAVNRERIFTGSPSVRLNADLRETGLTGLKDQTRRDSVRFGAKSANLGELMHAKHGGAAIPDGFSIPFYYYAQFIKANRLEGYIAKTASEIRTLNDPPYTRARLDELKQRIISAPFPEGTAQKILARVKDFFRQGEGLFVRSSTNSEDLKDFSGAGLYDTVPNVKSDEGMLQAVKTVWASIWNFRAFMAREQYGIDHLTVYPGVLIQKGIDADSAGVILTCNPLGRQNAREAVFIAAKKGIGIKVVQGKKIPEQTLYYPETGEIERLSLSEEDEALSFGPGDGLKETRVEPQKRVLSDETIQRLAGVALDIKKTFNGEEQDIEWVFKNGQIYIVQSRPYQKRETAGRKAPAPAQAWPPPPGIGECLNSASPEFLIENHGKLRSGAGDNLPVIKAVLAAYYTCLSFRSGNNEYCTPLAVFDTDTAAHCKINANELLFEQSIFSGNKSVMLSACKKLQVLSWSGIKDLNYEEACELIKKDYVDGTYLACRWLGDQYPGTHHMRLLGILGCIAKKEVQASSGAAGRARHPERIPFTLIRSAMKNGMASPECAAAPGCRAFMDKAGGSCDLLLPEAISAYCHSGTGPQP